MVTKIPIKSVQEKWEKFLNHIPKNAKTLFEGRRNEKIRDFILFENEEITKSPSAIIHIKTGKWLTMIGPYEMTRQILLAYPEHDNNLIALIEDT